MKALKKQETAAKNELINSVKSLKVFGKQFKNFFKKVAPEQRVVSLLIVKALKKQKNGGEKTMDAETLANRLIQGDENALEDIIEKFTPLVSTIIFNLSGGTLSTSDIEEVTSDTFITLWYNRDKVQTDKLKAYICCISKNKAKDRLKSTLRHKTVNIDEMDFEDGLVVPEKIENKILTEALRDALDFIGDPEREIIIRHYYYYQSSTEIAEKTGINNETVKSKIKRTREKLRKLLIERGFTK